MQNCNPELPQKEDGIILINKHKLLIFFLCNFLHIFFYFLYKQIKNIEILIWFSFVLNNLQTHIGVEKTTCEVEVKLYSL